MRRSSLGDSSEDRREQIPQSLKERSESEASHTVRGGGRRSGGGSGGGRKGKGEGREESRGGRSGEDGFQEGGGRARGGGGEVKGCHGVGLSWLKEEREGRSSEESSSK